LLYLIASSLTDGLAGSICLCLPFPLETLVQKSELQKEYSKKTKVLFFSSLPHSFQSFSDPLVAILTLMFQELLLTDISQINYKSPLSHYFRRLL